MSRSYMLDLVVLVADADAEWTLQTLLKKRTEALGIRALRFNVARDPGRDPGVFLRGTEVIRPYVGRAAHGIILLDREGSGKESLSAPEMETHLEERLEADGWLDERGQRRAAAIVLDPELGVWVWSPSPHVPQALGLTPVELKEVLADFQLASNGKPERPKEAMLAALRRSGRPHSARIFQELAERVSLRPNERAFDKLRQTLQQWFAKP